jgi:hypothetical protein
MLADLMCGSAKLNKLLRLAGQRLSVNLSLITWNEKHERNSDAC